MDQLDDTFWDLPALDGLALEKELAALFEALINDNRRFYYYFLRLKHASRYGLGKGTFGEKNFEKIYLDKGLYNNLLRAYSKKFRTYIDATVDTVKALAADPDAQITKTTLGSSITLNEWLIMVRLAGWSDEKILAFVKGAPSALGDGKKAGA